MNEPDVFALYEKLYFHEIDRRTAIDARANLPLALLLAQAGLLAFLLNKAPLSLQSGASQAFWCLFLIAAMSTAVAAWFLVRGLIRFTDKLLPTANATETYRRELIDLYAPYENSEALVANAMREYLYQYYMAFSSTNAVNNDARAYSLFLAVGWLTAAVVAGLLSNIPLLILIP